MKTLNPRILLAGLIGIWTVTAAPPARANHPEFQPVVTIHPAESLASEEGPRPGVLKVVRNVGTNAPLTVFYALDGSARNGVDYESLSGSVVIPAGSMFAPVVIIPIDDDEVEGDENVVVRIIHGTSAGAYAIGPSSNAVVTIKDNDFTPPPTHQTVVAIHAADPQASEGPASLDQDTGKFLIKRSGNTNIALRVFYNIHGTADNGVDYSEIPNSVVIPPGEHAAVILIRPIDDKLVEGLESVILSLQQPPCVGIFPPPPECYRVGSPSNAVVFIADNDRQPDRPVVTIVARDPFATESSECCRTNITHAGSPNTGTNVFCSTNNTATFMVLRSGGTNDSLTVHYAVGGTASNGVDYVEIDDTVTIPAGRRGAPIHIQPIADDIEEKPETVILSLRFPPEAGPADAPYIIGRPHAAGAVITDDCRKRPLLSHIADRCFHLHKPATNGFIHRIEVSSDMIHWRTICTNIVHDGAIHFVDPESEDHPNRFYRVVPEDSAPAE